MENRFFEQPILNSPYEYPARHWELDTEGQPTQQIVERRRIAEFITPIPKSRKRTGSKDQVELNLDSDGVSTEKQKYDPNPVINALRQKVDFWRKLPNPNDWQVTPETARLLQHWRQYEFNGVRPFFCQVEAAETLIWLTEVAPQSKVDKEFLEHITNANRDANPELMRIALKLATGAGKTTVMAMIIAWQTVNAVRRPGSNKFTRGFLIVTPGITIKDRLRVLQPADPDSYYKSRELVPTDMLPDLGKANIVITNYHSFKLRETMDIAAGNRALLKGRTGTDIQTLETEGKMIQRVMPSLMGTRNIMVLNDEAHHCYREKPGDSDEVAVEKSDSEAKENTEAARLWISGIEIVKRKLGLNAVVDLSATPFFLSGSGYAEGTLFPWTMSDFSLMDAIESGIVKLPRVPVADNLPGTEMPMFRDLWKHLSKGKVKLPKSSRAKSGSLDPLSLPTLLKSALEALYGHYKSTFELWQESGIDVPPCFIVVCQNTAISKLVYEYISGFEQLGEDGLGRHVRGSLELFRNFDEYDNPHPQPRTLLIDSAQLESGEALDDNFRKIAAHEIERFRREIIARTGTSIDADSIPDNELLREVMNTVGKKGRLGEAIRCVVSVSMLTEGWDANTVTHVLGVRAFGTQLLCEQVIGRALRRQSYDLNEDGLFNVEYADVLGIPFDFNAKPVVAKPQPPRETITVKAIRPDRDALEIVFPRVQGYRVELPSERLIAKYDEDSVLELNPRLVGPSQVQVYGIIGEGIDLTLKHLEDMRTSTLIFHLAKRLVYTKWRKPGDDPKVHLINDMRRVTKQWLDTCLVCTGGTYPAQLMYQELADMACEKITTGITLAMADVSPIMAVVDPYRPSGSTSSVLFNTSRTERWKTSPDRCHVNWVILDSDWEAEFCRVAETHPRVKAYVKNHSMGFEVPYRFGSENRMYRPDFIVLVDDGQEDPLHLVVEIKGYRGEDAKFKKQTMDAYWIPGVNHLKQYGRWAFAEFKEVFAMEAEFGDKVEAAFNEMIDAQVEEVVV